MTYEELLLKYLQGGYRPTRAVENALIDYNNSRGMKESMCIRTAWYKYKKIKRNLQNCSEKPNNVWYDGGVINDRQRFIKGYAPLLSSRDREIYPPYYQLRCNSSILGSYPKGEVQFLQLRPMFFEIWMLEPYERLEAI